MLDASQIDPSQLSALGEVELRELAVQLLARIERDTREIDWRDTKIEKLSFEMAQLRRMKFGASPQDANVDISGCREIMTRSIFSMSSWTSVAGCYLPRPVKPLGYQTISNQS